MRIFPLRWSRRRRAARPSADAPTEALLPQPGLALNEHAYSGPVPHYGQALALHADAVTSTKPPKEYRREYDLIKDHFDVAFYLTNNPGVAAHGVDPILHYIKYGAKEGRNPTPLFSTRRYVRDNRDALKTYDGTPFGHWIQFGRETGRVGLPLDVTGMAEVLGLSPSEIETRLLERHADVRERLAFGELGRMVARAAEVDPSVERTWRASFQLRLLPFSTRTVTQRISSLYGLQAALDWRRAAIVIAVSEAGRDGPVFRSLLADAVNAVGASNVVTLVTDSSEDDEAAETINGFDGVRTVAITGPITNDRPECCRLLTNLVRSLRPRLFVCCDSALALRTMQRYGSVMSAEFAVLATLPERTMDRFGLYARGPEAALYRLLPVLDALICAADDRDRVIVDHHLPASVAERVVSVEQFAERGGLAAFMRPSE